MTASGLYHGLVPAKFIQRRDLAVNGAVVSSVFKKLFTKSCV